MTGHFASINPLQEDMTARWRPTLEQQILAERTAANAPAGHAYTCHLLVGKSYGIWHGDIAVIALDGVFTDRAAALLYLEAATRQYHETTGEPVTGGWTRHTERGWAVFEDILASFPK